MKAIGLMSGTSLDGVDAALIETDGETIDRLGGTLYLPYDARERSLLAAALQDAAALEEGNARPGCLAEAETLVTRKHAEAVEALLAQEECHRGEIDIVGFHGQTVLHRPEMRVTVQLGDGPALATTLGIPVIHDFRSADIAAGGQGAPLVPVFHRAAAAFAAVSPPAAFLNIGGVANVTFLNEDGSMLAFDTGPGNALIDDFIEMRTALAFDEDGCIAAGGAIDREKVASFLTHPFFERKPPKSLDRNDLSSSLVDLPSLEDGAATLTAFTVSGIAHALNFAPDRPSRWIVAGGGARNKELMRLLSEELETDITLADDIGLSSAFMEAQAFAYLAVRSLKGLPITFPETTGIPRASSGGVVSHPAGMAERKSGCG